MISLKRKAKIQAFKDIIKSRKIRTTNIGNQRDVWDVGVRYLEMRPSNLMFIL